MDLKKIRNDVEKSYKDKKKEEEVYTYNIAYPINKEKEKDDEDTFLNRFSSNWTWWASRIIKWYKNLYWSYTSDDSIKNKALNTWLTWANTVTSALDMIIWSPISATLWWIWEWKTKDTISKIWEWVKWGGEQFTKWYSDILWRDLSKEEKDVTTFVWWEWLAEWATFWLLKWTSGAVKWVSKTAKKISENIFKKTDDIDLEITKQISDLNKQNNVFKSEIKTSELVDDLKNLYISTKEWTSSIKDVDFVMNKFWLKDKSFFENILEKNNKTSTINNKVSWNLFDWFYKKNKSSVIDNTIKKLDELWWKETLPNKERIKIEKSSWIDKSIIDEAVSVKWEYIKNNINSNLSNVHKFITDKSFIKKWETIENPYLSDTVIRLEERWLIKVNKKMSDWFEYKARFTKQWEKAFLKNEEIPLIEKEQIIRDWFSVKKDTYDYVSWDWITQANIIKNELSYWKKEFNSLWKQYFEIKSWNKTKTSEYDIVATIKKIDENYNLWLSDDINKIIDNHITWSINNKALDDVVSKIRDIRNKEFIKFSWIRLPKNINTIKAELWITEKYYNRVFQEWKLSMASEYKAKISEIEKTFNRKIRKIKQQKDILKDKYQWKLDELYQKRREDLIILNARLWNLWVVKSLIKKQLYNIYRNKDFLWDITKTAFKKIVNSGKLDNAKTSLEVNNAIDSIYKEITEEYARWLKKAVLKELDIEEVLKSSPRYKREKYTRQDRINLLTAKSLFNNIDWKLDIREVEKFYEKLKLEKKNAEAVAKWKLVTAKKEINKKIEIIKSQWIKNLDWLKNIINKREAWIIKKVSKGIKSINNELLFIPRLFENVFWKWSVWYKQFISLVNKSYNDYEVFFQNNTQKLMKNLYSLFGENVSDFWAYVFTINKTYKNWWVNYSWFERIIDDNLSIAKQLRTTEIKFNRVPDDFPLKQSHRDIIKWTKLWEVLEKYNTDKFIRWLELWNAYAKLSWNLINKTSIETTWIPLWFRDNYMTFKRLWWWDESIDIDIWARDILNNNIQDWFLKEITDHVKWMNYEYNPLRVLASSWRQQVYYSFMKKIFDQNKEILNWSNISIKDIDIWLIKKYLWWWQYKVINWEWKVVDIKSFKTYENWMVLTNNWLEKLDSLSLKSKWWLIDEFSPETKKYFSEYMNTIAKWWNFRDTTTEIIVSKIVSQANLLPLVWNLSVMAKQLLTLFDAKWAWISIFWPIKDIRWNPWIIKKLYEIEAVQLRWWWDYLAKEFYDNLSSSKKIIIPYKKYLEYWLYAMKEIDKATYSTIYYWAYKDFMIKNNLRSKKSIINDFSNPNAMMYAEDMANRVASTGNPLWMPSVYKNIYIKSFFWIFTTQLNRVQQYRWQLIEAYWDNSFKERILPTVMFFSSNIAEARITYWIWKFMYEIWATTYDKYWEDFEKNMFSAETLFRVTLWQTIVWSKVDSMLSWFSTSPVLWFWDKVAKDLSNIYKEWLKWNEEKVWELRAKTIIYMFWWKRAEQFFNIIKNNN